MNRSMKTGKHLFLLIVAIAVSCGGFAQDFKKQFIALNAAKDTAGQIALLKDWEKKAPEDPELYVSYYSYYVWKSKLEYIGLQKKQKGDNSLVLTDSTGKVAGYMNDVVEYDPNYIKMGFAYIDKAIKKFPGRLDLRFGKIYMLGETKNYKAFTEEILKTIDYSAKNKNAWLWRDNEPKKDGEKFLLEGIQNYVVQLYDTNDDSLLDNMKQIAERVLKYYPNHVESLSNVAIVYLVRKEYDKALTPLLKAKKIAPTDFIVLNNIAQAYKQKGDKPNAIKYYELTLKYGDADAKKAAQDELDALKK
ncbi:MAG: hypothetical protein JWP12_599 [Bacteroidetes bacterium]|nr:hypothetical protein [Bacteroidota bacterium]